MNNSKLIINIASIDKVVKHKQSKSISNSLSIFKSPAIALNPSLYFQSKNLFLEVIDL